MINWKQQRGGIFDEIKRIFELSFEKIQLNWFSLDWTFSSSLVKAKTHSILPFHLEKTFLKLLSELMK